MWDNMDNTIERKGKGEIGNNPKGKIGYDDRKTQVMGPEYTPSPDLRKPLRDKVEGRPGYTTDDVDVLMTSNNATSIEEVKR